MQPAPADTFWDSANRVPVLLASCGAIAAIATADWWTKTYVSLGFLYLFPITVTAGFLSRPAVLSLGVICAVLNEAFGSLDPTWRVSRFCFEALALAGCGLFVSELFRNRRLMLETQRRQRQTQDRLHALVETSPAAMLTVDQNGVIEMANQAAVDLMDPPGGALVGESVGEFLPDLQNAVKGEGRTRFRTSMECALRRASGEGIVAEVWFSTFEERGEAKLAAIIVDVTKPQPADAEISPEGQADGDRRGLNHRQRAVLRLVFEGLHNTEIAARLEMSPSAVKNVLHQLFTKAGARNRSELVRVALDRYRNLL